MSAFQDGVCYLEGQSWLLVKGTTPREVRAGTEGTVPPVQIRALLSEWLQADGEGTEQQGGAVLVAVCGHPGHGGS